MKPIIFNTEDVKAILDGRKSVTRRVMKTQPYGVSDEFCKGHVFKRFADMMPTNSAQPNDYYEFACGICGNGVGPSGHSLYKSSVKVGDILFVKETWCELCHVDADGITHYEDTKFFYKTDGYYQIDLYDDDGHYLDDQKMKWKPSIRMPKDAARIFLRVTDIRVERLQEITTEE